MTRISQSPRWRPADALDDLFVTHYASLVARAQHLVGSDRQAAEDLVHDAYVRLALRHFDAQSVQSVEAYLFTTLRNVHLSQVRRRQAKMWATASIIDCESAVAGLSAFSNDEERQSAYDALCQIVRYACLRKSTSTAAGVLILRFFHGYYPCEIAQVVRASEAAVAERLRMARAEARSYLANPASVRELDERRTAWRLDVRVHDDAASLQALQHAIFAARTGACLTARAFDRVYARAHESDPLDATTLGHLVSCPSCLDTVNRRLGLPLLADRDPVDRLGRGGRSGGSGGGGTGSASALKRALNARLAKVRESHPEALQIAVNGVLVASHAVNGAVHEQRLKIVVTEHVGFIEIFDEGSTCLLYLDVEPPPLGAVGQCACVSLSDGRQLSATLAFADASPTLSVLYEDPSTVAVAVLTPRPETDTVRREAVPARPAANGWSLWPVPFRFVFAGILLGLLLANPRQALAAMAHAGRTIVTSLVRVIEMMRPPSTLPSRSLVQPDGVMPIVMAVPPADVSTLSNRHSERGGRHALSDVELSELAVETYRALDDVGALTQEQIGVERHADRRLYVGGLVASSARRREVIAALRDLSAPGLRLSLTTVDEADRQPGTDPTAMADDDVTRHGAVRSAELTRDREPAAYESVRRSLSMPVTNAVRRVSGELLNQSHRARVQARTLQAIVEAVSPANVAQLSPEARATWRALIRRHAESFHQETEALRAQLRNVFPTSAGDANDTSVTAAAPVSAPTPAGDVWRTADRLFDLASAHDAGVRRAFAVMTDGSASLDVSTPAFRRSLLDAERLAAVLSGASASSGASTP